MAMASTPAHRSSRTAWRTPSSSSGCSTSPRGARPAVPRDVLHDRVVLRPLVAADMQDVAIATGGDHAGDGAVVLEDGIGGDGGAVEHHVDRLARDAVLVAKRHQPLHDAARRV